MYQGWLHYQAIIGVQGDCGSLEEMYYFHHRLSRMMLAAYVTMRQGKEGAQIILQDEIGWVQSVPPVDQALLPVIELLIRAIQPEKVFLWKRAKSSPAEVEEIALLLVLQDSLQQKFTELQPQLDMLHASPNRLQVNICTNGTFVEAFKSCDLFYLAHCKPQNLVYDLSGKAMPVIKKEDLLERKLNSRSAFDWAIKLAQAFYVQAQNSLPQSARLTALLLHQCAEHSYRALVTAFKGKEKRTHDLLVLHKMMEQIAPELYDVFDTEAAQQMLIQLNAAYSQSRYHQDYTISQEELALLSERVGQLPALAQAAFDRMMRLLEEVEGS